MKETPAWLASLRQAGFLPYVATSRHLLPSLELEPGGVPARVFLLEEEADQPFHEAYLLSNSLSFHSPDIKMPNWVLIDCALMQTAVVGFMKARVELPEEFLAAYRADPRVDLDRLDYLPISGQIASPGIDGKSLVGFSLFSLARQVGAAAANLGLYTKALALEVYRAARFEWFYGITQYDNPALKIHGRFGAEMEIAKPILPLHPRREMAFVYRMRPAPLAENPPAREPSFWLAADDAAAKRAMQDGIAAGKRYVILPPFAVARGGRTELPILEIP
ncbi:MAG: hypothetical protein PW734_02905 [Verrucomicrobium sp.]|nr:hypothetical protein [Verrucomicrobium sp.]